MKDKPLTYLLLLLCAISIVFFCYKAYSENDSNISLFPKAEADDGAVRVKSVRVVFIFKDPQYGCEYITTSTYESGIIQRLDYEGKHVGCKKALKNSE